ncbi:heparinase II/III family protein [Kiloniella laminariae]|uniref:heparinase II/III family protein n=1 Tax=Kiloniella laminariae TaxID=454162 RepID=UPI000365C79A|nr:heparinase II/III family protein [Kiloniella laminariae]
MEGHSQSQSPENTRVSDRWVRGKTNLSERLSAFFRLPGPLALARIRFKLKYLYYISPLFSLQVMRRPITSLIFAPSDPWLGNTTRGRNILAGQMELAGQIIHNPAPLWNPLGAEQEFVKELHCFGWLRDLRAVAGDQARRSARQMVTLWIEDNSSWRPLSWEPSMTGCRLYNWLGHYEFFGSSADIEVRQRLLESVAQQARYLFNCLPAGLTGVELIRAIKGLLYAGTCLPAGEPWLQRALRLLVRELPCQILPDGGHIQRSPHIHLEVLRHLIDIRATLHASGREVPGYIITAIESMSPVLRLFLHGDGGLCLFNDSNEDHGWQIDMVLQRAEGRKQPLMSAPQSGFQRIQSGRILLIADAGAPPPPGLDLSAHAGTLSFEMSIGRERLISNCGVQRHHPQWRWAPRATAAHSTATLSETNSAYLTPSNGLARRPHNVTCRRDERSGEVSLDMSHDGYLEKFGLVHYRQITVLAKGEGLVGIDTFSPPSSKTQADKVNFSVRFHLHPDVQASLINGADAILLRLQKGGGWQITCQGAHLSLEPSIYLGKAGDIRRSQQVIMSGVTTSNETKVDWNLLRVTNKKTDDEPDQSNLWDL